MTEQTSLSSWPPPSQTKADQKPQSSGAPRGHTALINRRVISSPHTLKIHSTTPAYTKNIPGACIIHRPTYVTTKYAFYVE